MSLACIWVYGDSNVWCLAQWSIIKNFVTGGGMCLKGNCAEPVYSD